jgi:hypothetical protein
VEEPTKEEEELVKASEDLWQEYIDPSSGCPYYYNLLTGETTWERPDAFKAATVVSAIAAAAASEKAKKTDERLADASEDGEVGAAFLLERWRRVAWREGKYYTFVMMSMTMMADVLITLFFYVYN